ncbi:ParB/RepB/Spo0J family partition protein [Falsiroseomonas sp. E2-1-a20]|uniref:ParB/RepB/Spo0J family partition protein n=1 Tax=Falsiroseomonas sp. E2-1-a20 TaxID=3239300 RepID=UPI003F2B07FF
MTQRSKFGALAQAVKDQAATASRGLPAAGADVERAAGRSDSRTPNAVGLHKPAVALGALAEGLRERVTRLEAELAQAAGRNTDLERALGQARSAATKAGDAVDEFVFLDPSQIRDELPRDRLPGAFSGDEFEDLLADIRENGQNDAITVRRSENGLSFEVAAGRRRLEACRRLDRPVLARVRGLDDPAMLRVQFSENERREDISALERARWFAAVRAKLALPSKDVAAQFGLDPSTLSLYLRLARFPDEIVGRLREPRRLSVLRARRVMEALEADAQALRRIVDAIDAHARAAEGRGTTPDPEEQVEVLVRAAEGRAGDRPGIRAALPERRHVVHRGRRVGTLTRNGGQWVFRFATSVGEDVVQALADRIGDLVEEVERASQRPS